MKQSQIMNRKIEKLSIKKNYDEILKILESKTVKPSLAYKDLSLSSIDFNHLKKFTMESILKCLHSGDDIPCTLINISILLGEEHMEMLRSSISSFVVSRKMLDISQFIQDHLNDLSALSKIFYFIENTLEIAYKEYENLPHSWNLDLKILNRSIVTLKHAICEYFFTNEPQQEALAEGLKASIAFEKKLENYFNLKKCCMSKIEFCEENCTIKTDSSDIKCIHKRMISTLFIPYLDIFINFQLSKSLNQPFDQLKSEKNIIKQFIDFFKNLQGIYDFLCYFQEKSVFVDLFQISDKLILSLLQKIRLGDDSNQLMILYSTLLYIQKIIEDFSNRLIENHRIECISKSLAATRKLERAVDSKIEREISTNYPENLEKLPESICESFSNFCMLDDEVKKNVFEICMIQILLKIRQIKLNIQKAGNYLDQIIKLEELLSKKFKIQTTFGLLKNYLKIFTFPIDNPTLFLENFNKLSSGKFDLTQVLKAFEDQHAAQQIYQTFKNSQI